MWTDEKALAIALVEWLAKKQDDVWMVALSQVLTGRLGYPVTPDEVKGAIDFIERKVRGQERAP